MPLESFCLCSPLPYLVAHEGSASDATVLHLDADLSKEDLLVGYGESWALGEVQTETQVSAGGSSSQDQTEGDGSHPWVNVPWEADKSLLLKAHPLEVDGSLIWEIGGDQVWQSHRVQDVDPSFVAERMVAVENENPGGMLY